MVALVSLFNGMSTFVAYLMQKPSSKKNSSYTIQYIAGEHKVLIPFPRVFVRKWMLQRGWSLNLLMLRLQSSYFSQYATGTGDLVSVEYSLIVITPRSTLSQSGSNYSGSIYGLRRSYENHSYSIGPCAKKDLKNYTKNDSITSRC